MGARWLTGKCLGKHWYRSKDAAQQELDRWRACGYHARAEGKAAYGCDLCGGGHIGEKRRKVVRQGRR